MSKDCEHISAYIAENKETYDHMSDAIWDFAEFRFEEVRSCKIQMDFLREEGFRITEKIADMDTAFMAEWGEGGPLIGILGEYDALPGLSQAADIPVKTPLEGKKYGHACGHNLLGTAAVEAAAAVKNYLLESHLPGRVRFYACPAEEGAAAKTFMLKRGCFVDLDSCLSWHPDTKKQVGGSTLSNVRIYYKFHGIAAHAAATPHLGRSALDSVELMDVGSNYLREHIIPEARLHYAITNSGGTMPNIVQAEAEVCYTIRAPKTTDMLDIYDRVNDIAKGAALMSGTKVESRPVSYYANYLDNRTLNVLTQQCMDEIMDENYSQEELDYAAKFIPSMMPQSLHQAEEEARKYGTRRDDAYIKSPISLYSMPMETPKSPSTDYGNVSWVVPCAVFNVPCYAAGTVLHNWQATAQGKAKLAHHGRDNAAAIMALTAVRLFEQPELIDQAKADLEFIKGGEEYRNVLPDDVIPGDF